MEYWRNRCGARMRYEKLFSKMSPPDTSNKGNRNRGSLSMKADLAGRVALVTGAARDWTSNCFGLR